jgi:hypothetical protein
MAGRGNGIFAISPACHRRRRIALSRWTPPQPKIDVDTAPQTGRVSRETPSWQRMKEKTMN